MKKNYIALGTLALGLALFGGIQAFAGTNSQSHNSTQQDNIQQNIKMEADAPKTASDLSDKKADNTVALAKEDSSNKELTQKQVEEIDAVSGKIYSRDHDIENDHDHSHKKKVHTEKKHTEKNIQTRLIQKLPRSATDKAMAIVLNRVNGASANNVEMELEKDNGCWVYEGEVHYNGTEYDFELNAKTGAILEWSAEVDD